MKKRFFILVLGLLAAPLLTAYGSQSNKIGQCHVRDNRFACHGKLQADGQGELKFTKTPKQDTFQLTKFSLDKVDANGDAMDYRDCSGNTGDVTTERDFKFRCQKLNPGTYYVKFKLSHSMPKSYQPRKSENCVLIKQNMATKWQCTTSGEFKYVIQ